MNNSIPKVNSSDIGTAHLAVAWDWVLRLRQDSVSQDDLTAWLSWYEADERNKAAFEDMQAFWQQIDQVTEEPNPLPPELWLGDLAASGTSHTRRLQSARTKTTSGWRGFFAKPSPRRLAWASAALAASLCCLTVALKLASPPLTSPPLQQHAVADNAVDVAAPQSVKETYLPDGSRVELAAKSSVSLQFSDTQRMLEMQGGVAYFAVAHNRDRPFIVKVGDLYVRAVGTAFNIRSAGDRVVVTVAEGTVDVYPASHGNLAIDSGGHDASGHPVDLVRVKAGSEVVWAEKSLGPTIATVDASHALAWRQGRLDYLNEPLASAIADINRYSKRPIILRDDAIGKIVFSGTVLTNATDAWVAALPSLFPIDVHTDSNGNIVLSNRASVEESR
jgi:transmembrane sensor